MDKKNIVFSWLYVQLKFHVLVSFEQQPGVSDVVLIDMHVGKVQRDGFQWEVNLPGHEVEVVDVGWQAEVRVRAALVSRHH